MNLQLYKDVENFVSDQMSTFWKIAQILNKVCSR